MQCLDEPDKSQWHHVFERSRVRHNYNHPYFVTTLISGMLCNITWLWWRPSLLSVVTNYTTNNSGDDTLGPQLAVGKVKADLASILVECGAVLVTDLL